MESIFPLLLYGVSFSEYEETKENHCANNTIQALYLIYLQNRGQIQPYSVFKKENNIQHCEQPLLHNS